MGSGGASFVTDPLGFLSCHPDNECPHSLRGSDPAMPGRPVAQSISYLFANSADTTACMLMSRSMGQDNRAKVALSAVARLKIV